MLIIYQKKERAEVGMSAPPPAFLRPIPFIRHRCQSHMSQVAREPVNSSPNSTNIRALVLAICGCMFLPSEAGR